MPSEQPAEFQPQLRLHSLSWIFTAARYLRQFVAPLVVALVVGARAMESYLALLAIVPLLGAAFWHQHVYRYGFGAAGLVIREGLLFRNLRTIDYRRIENIDTERNVLHRLLGVAEVRVETSSGGGSEATIRVLSLDDVQRLREQLFAARDNRMAPASETPGAAAEQTLLQLGPGELIRYGLIDNRGLIVVAAVFGLISQAGEKALFNLWFEWLSTRLPVENFAALGPLLQSFLVISTVAGLIAGTRVLSVLLALVALHDFRLTRQDEELRARYGLFTRIALTLRRPRIQAVHIRESLLHRWFKRRSLTVDLAGGLAGNDGEQQHASRKLWLAPVCTPERAGELVAIALPGAELDALEWQRLSPKARWRLFRLLSLVWLAAASAPAIVLLHAWAAALLLPALPLLWLYADIYVRYTGWAMNDRFFAVRRGWLNRRISLCPRNRVQSVHVAESPFDRRYRMATLSVDTAGAGHAQLRLPFLERETVERLAQELPAPR